MAVWAGHHGRGILRRTTRASYETGKPEWTAVLDIDALAKAENANWVYKGSDCARPAERRCLISPIAVRTPDPSVAGTLARRAAIRPTGPEEIRSVAALGKDPGIYVSHHQRQEAAGDPVQGAEEQGEKKSPPVRLQVRKQVMIRAGGGSPRLSKRESRFGHAIFIRRGSP